MNIDTHLDNLDMRLDVIAANIQRLLEQKDAIIKAQNEIIINASEKLRENNNLIISQNEAIKNASEKIKEHTDLILAQKEATKPKEARMIQPCNDFRVEFNKVKDALETLQAAFKDHKGQDVQKTLNGLHLLFYSFYHDKLFI